MRPRGTIIQRGRRYAVVIDRGSDPITGRRLRDWYSGFTSRREAEQEKTRLLYELDSGTYVDPLKLTLGHYLLEEWLPSRKPESRNAARGHRGQVDLRTWATNRQHIETYVIAHLGHVPLQDLTAEHLDGLYDLLEESGGEQGRSLSARTVLHVHRTLHKALKDAVRRGKLTANVAAVVEAPRASKAETAVWTVDELRAFLDHVRHHRVYAAWLLFATTGMRRGEVAALCREDLDLDQGRLSVSSTLGMVDNMATWKRSPKSKAGKRIMALDPATIDALRRRLAEQAEHRLALGVRWPSTQTDWRGESRDDPIFSWPDGRVISPDRYTEWFVKARRAAGLSTIRLHDLRHTYATVGLRNATGWHEVKVISQRLGHASIGFTLDTYAHVLPAADEQTAHTLARHILGEAT